MRIILAGATGLVGGLALKRLLSRPDVESVTTVTRRPMPPAGDKHAPIVAPMEEWSDLIAKGSYDVGICCLGTTIRAAGSKEAFAAVDLNAVRDFATACQQAGARQFIMVTSVGADAAARNFYLSTKGKAEAAVQQIGFDRVDIMRPGLLVGHRGGPVRIGERLAIAVSPLTDLMTPSVLSRYRSIPAQAVASAVVARAGAAEPGVFKHHDDDMRTTQSVSD